MTEKQQQADRQRREDIEREIRSNPVLSELMEKHGAQIREIKILKENP